MFKLSWEAGVSCVAMPEITDNLVSTIIPIHNRPRLLREAVESVLGQTHRPIEIIISDDGSIDDTPQVIRELIDAHPDEISGVRNENQGPGPAREAGRLAARGEFIQYLDSDDLLWPRKFEAQVAALRASAEYGVAYGYSRLVREGQTPEDVPYKWTGREMTHLFPALLVDHWWCTHTPLYRRSVTDAVGSWSDIRWGQDWDYAARVGGLDTRLVQCKEFVSDHRKHSGAKQTEPDKRFDPEWFPHWKRLLQAMYEGATRVGVTSEAPEMQHFSRVAFMVARELGAVGWPELARECLGLAKRAAGPRRAKALDFRFWNALVHVIGWRAAGRLAFQMDRVRRGAGHDTLHWAWSQGHDA